jgi:putative endonuclease
MRRIKAFVRCSRFFGERLESALQLPAFRGPSTPEPVSLGETVPALRMTMETRMKEHGYFVYIMSSRSGTLYIGMTNSIYRRALQHKRGEIDGFSNKYRCNRLVYCESFDNVHKAIGREKQLKGWRRSKKIALIESKNLRWEDLAEKWGSQMLFAGGSIKASSLIKLSS